MSISVLDMSMSLDGYIAGPNDEPANPGGDQFMRLHDWYGFGPNGPDTSDLKSIQQPGMGQHFIDEVNATGAVLAGRRTVEQVDHWKGDHHGVPIFVPSHRPPGPSVETIRWSPMLPMGLPARWHRRKRLQATGTCWCTARTRRNGHSRLVYLTSCNYTRYLCYLGVVGGCSTCCHRVSSWR